MVGIFEVLLPVLVPPTCGIETLEQRSSTLPISSIADVEEPLLRNELITHNYWRIAQRFYERFGDENLVWPTFGSWASSQAGAYMRLGASPAVRAATVGKSWHVTELLAAGNQLIFKDIAPPFWRFLDLLDSLSDREISTYARRADLQAVLGEELQLDLRSLDQSADGEQLMVLAFEQYLRALVEPNADARAERMFVANGCVGLQEQTRVDCVLDAMLDIPEVNHTVKKVLAPLRPGLRLSSRAAHTIWPTVSKTLGGRGPEIERKIRSYRRLFSAIFLEGRATQVLGTQLLLELQLGTTHFDLGEDISEARFAPGLRHITLGAADFQTTFQKVAAWDRTPDSAIDSAALDWSDLSDRMNYILDLFRTQQGRRKLNVHPLAS